MDLQVLRELAQPGSTKIVLLVLDGLGGLELHPGGPTELGAARTPHLDALARRSNLGLIEPVGPGITPGSGPGHLSLFGYDPLVFRIGRGILEALGIDLEVTPHDIAARGNFCTVDEAGNITDRRAGRIDTDLCTELCRLLDGFEAGAVRAIVRPVREHRFVVAFRGEGLAEEVTESDPQRTGVPPLRVEAKAPAAARTAEAVNAFADRARQVLHDRHPANMVLLRGFSQHPKLPTFQELYRLDPVAIAVYPMYRGLAKLAGMKALPTGPTVAEEFRTLGENLAAHDFFYLHVKRTDSTGEDGNFDGKVATIEEVDREVPALLAGDPDVLIVTGDHSTPARLRSHSWHPVPVLFYAKTARADGAGEFSERACRGGGLGLRPGIDLLPLALAHAGRLAKFGA